jgi:hypothetical protein
MHVSGTRWGRSIIEFRDGYNDLTMQIYMINKGDTATERFTCLITKWAVLLWDDSDVFGDDGGDVQLVSLGTYTRRCMYIF